MEAAVMDQDSMEPAPIARRVPSDDTVALGRKIKQRRIERGMIQAEVAAQMGCATSMVGHWESGFSRIIATDLKKLAQILDCTVSFLTGDAVTTSDDEEWLQEMRSRLAIIPPSGRGAFRERMLKQARIEEEYILRER